MEEWDRSHSWVIHRTRHDRARITIRFKENSPSGTELLAVRDCFHQFRDKPPKDIKAMIADRGELPVGIVAGRQVHWIKDKVAKLGLKLIVEDASYVSHLPFDRTTNCVWLIEDSKEAKIIAEKMIASGVPIEDAEE